MARVFDIIPFVFLIGIFPYLIPAIMPTWRTLAVCVLLIGGALAYVWIDHAIAVRAPNFKEGRGDAMGLAMVAIATTAFGVGCVVRVVGLVARKAGARFGHEFAIGVLGFPIVIAIYVAPAFWHEW